MEARKEKLERIKLMILLNEESRASNKIAYSKQYLFDKLEQEQEFLDSALHSYKDCIEFMTEEQFAMFQKFQVEKYMKLNF